MGVKGALDTEDTNGVESVALSTRGDGYGGLTGIWGRVRNVYVIDLDVGPSDEECG